MFFLLPYSCSIEDSPKRAERVFHDLAARPATPRRTTRVPTIIRGLSRNFMVLTAAPNRTRDMIVTPALEMVIISATNANGMAQAQMSLSLRGSSEVRAATITGAVVHNNTDRLLDSSTVPGTR